MSADSRRILWTVGGFLAVLTLVEYIVAIQMSGNFVPLAVMALVKAVLIVYFFMHVYRLWRKEAH